MKLYTHIESQAEIWRKLYPNIEIVMTPKQYPPNPKDQIKEKL